MASFDRIGRIMMAWTMESAMSPEWRKLVDEELSDDWFESLKEFISGEVQECYGHHTPPTLDQLCSLPFDCNHPGAPGAYMDIVTHSLDNLQPVYIYTGCTLRAVKERIAEYGQPKALVENPSKKYDQLREFRLRVSFPSSSLSIPFQSMVDSTRTL